MSLAIKAKELREERGKLEAESKKLIETAESEDRDLTNEEAARFKAIHEDDCKLRDRIANIEKQLQQSAELDKPFDRRRTAGSAVGSTSSTPRLVPAPNASGPTDECRLEIVQVIIAK